MEELTDQQWLVVGVMASLVSALSSVVEGRDHHRLCHAACNIIPTYKEQWPQIYAEKWADFDDQRKSDLKKIYDHVAKSSEIADAERESQYRQANQRSLVFIADVFKNLTESFLKICLAYGDQLPHLHGTTSDKKKPKSVKAWELSLGEQRRSRRFVEMIQTFLPEFELDDSRLDRLDNLMARRNRLVHESIPVPTKGEILAPLPEPTLLEVDQFHVDVAEFIEKLKNEFWESSGLDNYFADKSGLPN